MYFRCFVASNAQVVASWDLLELPVVDSEQWEANRAAAREADAAFDAELLRRAQQWREEAEEASSMSATEGGSSGAATPPPRAYEHEHSQDFVNGAEVAASAAAAPAGAQRSDQGASAVGPGASEQQGSGAGAAEANVSAAATANTGLVGIMFDAMV